VKGWSGSLTALFYGSPLKFFFFLITFLPESSQIFGRQKVVNSHNFITSAIPNRLEITRHYSWNFGKIFMDSCNSNIDTNNANVKINTNINDNTNGNDDINDNINVNINVNINTNDNDNINTNNANVNINTNINGNSNFYLQLPKKTTIIISNATTGTWFSGLTERTTLFVHHMMTKPLMIFPSNRLLCYLKNTFHN